MTQRLAIVRDGLGRSGAEAVSKNTRAADGASPEVDGFIFDTGCGQRDIAYVLALAVFQKKPILFIDADGDPAGRLAEFVDAAGESVMLSDGDPAKLPSVVDYFLQQRVPQSLEQSNAQSVKFTLRISPRLERFLDRKARELRMSKADFLRQQAEKMMEGEEGTGTRA